MTAIVASSDLEISRFIAAPRPCVWEAWRDPAHLVQWWCPKPWTTELRGFEFRTSGAFYTFMRGPDGGESDNPGAFLDVTPMQRIVFTSTLREGWRPAKPWLAFTAFFSLADEGAGTRYQVRVLHDSPESGARHAEMGFFEGWGVCITQLQEAAQAIGGVRP